MGLVTELEGMALAEDVSSVPSTYGRCTNACMLSYSTLENASTLSSRAPGLTCTYIHIRT